MSNNAGLGFQPYAPRAESQKLIDDIKAVLEEYRAHLPLTCRQVYYRLVATYGYPKTKAFYDSKLIRVLALARRGELIDMEDIRDDGGVVEKPFGRSGLREAIESIKGQAHIYQRYRHLGQKYRTFIYCEAKGMVPQLFRVARNYGVPVHSKGGYDSLTLKHEFAEFLHDQEIRAVVWHLGDFDPSGVDIYATLKDELRSFVGQMAARAGREPLMPIIRRLALTEKQIKHYDLPTDIVNSNDKRAATWEGVDNVVSPTRLRRLQAPPAPGTPPPSGTTTAPPPSPHLPAARVRRQGR